MDSGKKYRARWGYLAASIIVFIIELIIALYVTIALSDLI